MATITELPRTLTRPQVEALRNAFGHFYDQLESSNFEDKVTGIKFNNSDEFINEVWSLGIPQDTPIKFIGITLEKWYETVTQTPEFSGWTTTPTPEPGAVSNSLTPEQLKQFEKEAEEREIAQKETQINAKESVESAIERKRELADETRVREALKDKKIIVTPTEELPKVNLTQKEKEQIYNLAQAVKADPATAQKIIEQKIQEAVDKSSPEIKENVSGPVITKYATNLVETVKPLAEYKNPSEIPNTVSIINSVSPFVSISNPDDPRLIKIIADNKIREELTQKSKILSLALEAENNFNHSLTTSLLGSENISEVFYPQTNTQFQIAEDQNDQRQKDEGAEISLSDVYDQGRNIFDVWQKLANGTTTIDEATTSILSVIPSHIPSITTSITNEASSFIAAALPATVGTITGFGSSVLATQMVSTNLPMLMGPQMAGLLTSGGIQGLVSVSTPIITKSAFAFISNTGQFAFITATGETAAGTSVFAIGAKLGQSTIAVMASSTGIKVAASGVFAKIGAFLGSVGPVVGTVIGAAVGWLVGKTIEKIPWKKIGPWLLGGLAGIGAFMFAGPVAGIVVGLGTLGLTSAVAGGTGVTLGAIGSGIVGFFGVLSGAFLGAIWKPIVAILVGFPILVALILFIINSGAYVVPPGSLTGTIGINCNTTQSEGQASQFESPAANDAVCIVSYLNQFNLNPLSVGLLDTPSWQSLTEVLPEPAFSALASSAPVDGHLQCVGFAAATAGFAYGQAFGQINACSYINNPPAGYTYVAGTSGIASGDFFLIDGSGGCNVDSPGHIGVVLSVDGALISCADANYDGPGHARTSHGCFSLAQLAGYLRKQ